MRELNFKELNKTYLGGVTRDVLSSMNGQVSFGQFIEGNIIAGLNAFGVNNNIKVHKSSNVEDVTFGADFKVTFSNPFDSKVDGMSSYVDLTIRKKERISWLGVSRTDRGFFPYTKKMGEDPDCFGYLSNGLKVHFGIKRWNGGMFQYKKPVLVCYLSADSMLTDFYFGEDDINILVNRMRRAIFFVSHNMRGSFNNKEVVGYGKRASKIIAISDGYDEIACSK